jgi:hypothetical protein
MALPTTIGGDSAYVASSAGIGTYGPINLTGGLYGVSVGSGSSGTGQLQRVLSDGSTANVLTTALASGAYASVSVPPGIFQIVVATAGADVAVSKIR